MEPRRWSDVGEGSNNQENFHKFQDKAIRAMFVRKVYALLSLNLLYMTGITVLFVLYEPVQVFVVETPAFTITLLAVAVGSLLAITFISCCCQHVFRKVPINYVILFVFTISMGTVVAIISSMYEVEEVFMALGITCLIVFAATLFACQTKYDFTACTGVIIALAIGLFVLGIVAAISTSNILNTLYAVCGAVLATIFLIVDTQLIMGGHRVEISPEDYVLATIMLYMDVVRLFLFILRLVGGKK